MRHAHVLALLLAATAAAPAAAADPPKRVALLVGVDQYDHPGLETLRYCGRDATELGKVLVANGFTTRVITSADRSNPPTRKAIEAALRDACKDLTRRDTVLFAFSGQGVQLDTDRGSDVYLCPADARLADPATLVSVTALLKTLGDSGAGTCLVLLDACRNDPNPARGPTVAGFDRLAVRPNTGVLLACSAGERTYESETLKHGVFTTAVLQGLAGKARDATGEVTWDSLAAYVRKTTPRLTAEAIGKERTQQPHLIANMAGPPVVLVPAGGPSR